MASPSSFLPSLPHPSPLPPPPPELRTATSPRGPSCDAHWFPTFRSSASPQPPAQRLGKGQVCKGEESTKSRGPHQSAVNTNKAEPLPWGQRRNATPAVPGRGVAGGGARWGWRRWAGAGRRALRGGGVPGGCPSPPLPTRLPRHLSGAWGQRRAPARPARQVARPPARPPAPPAAARSAERRGEPQPTASCFLPPRYGESSPGAGRRGERGGGGATAGSTHTQPPARRTPRSRGHVPAESPRDRPRSHKAPRSGQGGREPAPK